MRSNKRRVFLAIYHREGLSLRQNRHNHGLAAFHWAILIIPKGFSGGRECDLFQVTDASLVDPLQHINLNPNFDWRYQTKTVDPYMSMKLVALVMIGKVDPSNRTDVASLLEQVPLPVRNVQPEQNCVSWTIQAVAALQDRRLAERFDVRQLMDFGADIGARSIDEEFGMGTDNQHNFTTRPM